VYKKGESLWAISQTYAIRLGSLIKKNHLQNSDLPIPGQVLWLKKTRPKDAPMEIHEPASKKSESVKPVNKESPISQDSSLFSRDSIIHQVIDPIPIPLETAGDKKIELDEDQKYQIHIVNQGETLYSISRNYNCPVEQIMEANNLDTPAISINQTLKIPILKTP